MPKNNPYVFPVDEELSAQLLNSRGLKEDGILLGERLSELANEIEQLVKNANEFLEESEFAGIVADTLARKANRRGWPRLQVEPSGRLVLQISYEDPEKKKIKRSRRVPLLKELRAEAKGLGVDVSGFGIKRRAIYEYLQKVRSGTAAGADKGISKKPKSIPVVKKADDEADPESGPMSAGPDETKVSPPPEGPKPPKKGFVKTGDPVRPVLLNQHPGVPKKDSGRRHDLRALVEQSKDVDIAAILDSEPPQK